MADQGQDAGLSRRRRPFLGLALIVVGLAWVSPATGLVPRLVLRNTADSIPVGWYLYQRTGMPDRGEIMAVGHPPGFSEPFLLKRALGLPGDRYCWDAAAGTHLLNGRAMPPPLPEAVAMGVPVWKGCRELGVGEIVGYGDTRDSFDSRYIGPVRLDDLWGIYRRL